ncbi:MAG: hypothetical protein LIO93_04705 [Bacteroidales bacterium]|nr:hypothetical protein [Bacteroidales bacterium]
MKIIDIDHWDRREHYLFFRRMDYPHYHIGTDLDITYFKARIKEQGLPFSFAMTYAVTSVMNKFEPFRYRIHGNDVVLHDKLHPSFAYLAPDRKYFKMVTMNLTDDISEFSVKARKKALEQEKYFVFEDVQGRDDLIYISSIPQVSFTHLSHTISFNKNDAVPRLSWGKYFSREERIMLPFNIQAHHAFVDGDHMGIYIDALQEYFDSY